MSKYTTQLRWIVEQLGQGLDVPSGQEYADAVYKYIGLDKYPIYDEAYRKILNDKIIDHYYFREIGFETAAQFAWYMRRTMNEIMPKYNHVYLALKNEAVHPLSDWTRHRDIQSEGTTANQSNTNGEVDSTAHNRNIFQDTPMSMLNNSGEPQIENMDYATNVTYDDNNSSTDTTSATNSNGTSTLDRVEDEYGRNHSIAYLAEEYIQKFVDVDLMVIEDLNNLFMGLW